MPPADPSGQTNRRRHSAWITLPNIVFVINVYPFVPLQPTHLAVRRRVIRMIVLLVIQRHPDGGSNIGYLPVACRIAIPVVALPVIPENIVAIGRESGPAAHFVL